LLTSFFENLVIRLQRNKETRFTYTLSHFYDLVQQTQYCQVITCSADTTLASFNYAVFIRSQL